MARNTMRSEVLMSAKADKAKYAKMKRHKAAYKKMKLFLLFILPSLTEGASDNVQSNLIKRLFISSFWRNWNTLGNWSDDSVLANFHHPDMSVLTWEDFQHPCKGPLSSRTLWWDCEEFISHLEICSCFVPPLTRIQQRKSFLHPPLSKVGNRMS